MTSELAVETGQAVEAQKDAREALDRFLKEQNPSSQASAYNALARAYLAGMKIREARDAVEQASALPRQTYRVRLSMRTTAARVDESRSPADAITQLQSIVEDATSTGHHRLAFEARLRLAEIEMRAGELATGRARLESLRSEAGKRGFALVAGKARAALDAPRPDQR